MVPTVSYEVMPNAMSAAVVTPTITTPYATPAHSPSGSGKTAKRSPPVKNLFTGNVKKSRISPSSSSPVTCNSDHHPHPVREPLEMKKFVTKNMLAVKSIDLVEFMMVELGDVLNFKKGVQPQTLIVDVHYDSRFRA
ncbi:hypothetical protein JCGZ_00034 [Jatropha curcas]|uniref:Uncharacterized protein n=1 Tax=Jatropha curcas TaxID=180498 RepID=A0A067J8P6_JATCU|nr:hypothetical protein JCGZ_00034 [Jatropha curcas]